ncbi:MAG: ROK family protein [Burkholderiales bacterium]|nr:ROK family protein [Anaerolineae bacterium]
MSVSKSRLAVGVDIGGTNMSAIVLRVADGAILARKTIETRAAKGPDDGIRRLIELIEHVVADADVRWQAIEGIGVGCSGPLDLERGLIQNPFTLPTWDDLPIVDHLKSAFNKPTLLLNDAQAAALGEHQLGAGRGTRDMVYITVSTGIGGGLILNGQLYRGYQFMAGEIGHHSLNFEGPACYCGRRGCWEMYASGTAVAKIAQARTTPESQLWRLAHGQPEAITARMIGQAAQNGDPLSLAIFRELGMLLGVGISNLINIVAPEIFVLSGGVMQSHAFILPSIIETVWQQKYAAGTEHIRIVTGQLGLNAGVIGAAYAVMRFIDELL